MGYDSFLPRMKRDFLLKMTLAFPGWFSPRPSILISTLPALGEDQATGAQPSSQPVSYLLKLAVVARGGADPARRD
jgi:hypothetical protein